MIIWEADKRDRFDRGSRIENRGGKLFYRGKVAGFLNHATGAFETAHADVPIDTLPAAAQRAVRRFQSER